MEKSRRLILCIGFSLGVLSVWAADLEPWMLEKGAAVFMENFSTPPDPAVWISSKGTWSVEQGILKGIERPDDHHPAVIRREAPLRNVIIQFDFRFEGSTAFALSLNEAGGHNSRITVSPSDFTMTRDLDKKDLHSYTALLGECVSRFESGKWYTMLVEYYGDTMLARINDHSFTLGTDPVIDRERTSIGFPVTGEAMMFDNVKVWQGTLRKEWPAKQSVLEKLQQTRPPVARGELQSAWKYAEMKARGNLMKTDPAFVALVDARAAADTAITKAYPKAFRKNDAAAAEKKRLQQEDPEYKTMNASLSKARRAEQARLFEMNPPLEKQYRTMMESRKKQLTDG